MTAFGTREQIRVGAYFAVCCELDLSRIETEDEAEECRQLWDENMGTGVWESEATAVADLAARTKPEGTSS